MSNQQPRPPMLYGRENFQRRTQEAVAEAHKTVITIDDRHRRKAVVILEYARRFSIPYLIETGTAYGEMVETVRDRFEKIWTIELKEDWYTQAKANFADCPGVTPLWGDSAEVLAQLLPQVDKPVIFYLDAHYSGGGTERGREDTPILRELDAIFAHTGLLGVIVIDDLLSFRMDPAYPRPVELYDYIHQCNPRAQIEERGEMIVVTPKKRRA